jgi:hypothetical protein
MSGMKNSKKPKNFQSTSKTRKTRITPKKYRAMTENPELFGEEDISGNMPNPESDDDSLETAQEWGQLLESDSEHHEEEIDPQRAIDLAERKRRKSR